MTLEPEKFEIHVGEDVLEDLKRRLQSTRWSPDADNDDWRYGTSRKYLRHFVEYWIEEYDWRRVEEQMNRFEHYRVTIDEVPVHFMRVRGKGDAPVPLILTHGWPWTYWDFAEVVEPLAAPSAFGAAAADSFDVVVPSLPGFAFSSPLDRAGIGAVRTSEIWRSLARDTLGWQRYGLMGGDFGAVVSQRLAHDHPEDIIGVHLTRYRRPATGALGETAARPEDYAHDEAGDYERDQAGAKLTTSHMTVQSTDPQSLAFAFNDSPVGLAAWLIERRRAWSDCQGDVEKAFSRDQLITSIMIYWITQTIGTSMRFYWETARENRPITGPIRIDAPLAIGVLPADISALPRKHAQEDTDLRQWTRFSRGGHFGPAEVPDLLVDDLRSFFRPLRSSGT